MSSVTRWSWPARFAIIQFPNPPLAAALLASAVASLSHGAVHRALTAFFYASLSVWAYEEARHGANWFRRLLGVGSAGYLLVSLARALHRP